MNAKTLYSAVSTLVIILLTLVVLSTVAVGDQDPLPSWVEGTTKQSIMRFVRTVTDKSSPVYVPPEERIATFDNDGTLWAEQPMYVQIVFALDRVKALAPKHPEWKTKQPLH
jgi:hypothetical protein